LQTDVVVTDLTIAGGNTLDVTANDYLLEVRGSFANSGNFVPQEGLVNFTATTTGQTIDTGPSEFYDMTFDGVGGSWAFPAGEVTAQNDVVAATGTVVAPTGTFEIGGSFDASSGTFVHNNGKVELTSNSLGEVVTPGDNPFYDLTFFGGGGAWSFGQVNATTSGAFEILAGSVTLPSAKLYVVGDFQNEAGSFDANGGLVELYTVDTQKLIELSGSVLNDVRFDGVSAGTGNWYSTAWPFRYGITVQSGQVDGDVSDFPVYVDLAGAPQSLWDNAQEDGGDIRVADDLGNEVPIDLVSYATTTQTGELHFRASDLSASSDTTYYIYYGNTLVGGYLSDDPFGAENVWTNGYVAVYHLEEEASGTGNIGVYVDSSSAGADADDYLSNVGVSGKFGYAADFTEDTDTDLIDIPYTVVDGRTDMTISWWMQSSTGGSQAVVSGANSSDNNEMLAFITNNGTTFNSYIDGQNPGMAVPDLSNGSWRHVAWIRDDTNNQHRVYVDGVEPGSSPVSSSMGTANIDLGGLVLGQEQDVVGGNYDDAQAYNGYLDEVRFAVGTRTASWLLTEFNSQNAPDTFYATTSVETVASRTFADTNATVAGDVTIVGGLVTLPGGILTLEGSLDNASGLFDANDGTVLFATSSVGHEVYAGGSDFYDITFDDAAGGWTIMDDATSTNDWTLTAASSFDVLGGVRVAVEGVFENTTPSTTNWAGSTLALYGGTSYTVGDRWQVPESYGDLEIGPDTDVRLWQSDAAAYAVDAAGSLYSQDHANNDGDLYIWGAYERTSGTDYWSHATDFEGTPLGGSSRPANVHFADGASALFTGSTLEMQGSGGTTTVQNQGSGTYALAVDDGTIDAQYYSITDTNIDGLSLLGSTTVTSLADGAFTLATDGGSMLTVASTTVDENPALQIQRATFSTSSGIASGFNVSLNDTPSSYWWFRNHVGNFDGEVHDNDDGNPGSIRWDDSGFTVQVSGTVYSGEGVGVGTVCDDTTAVVTLAVNGAIASTTNCSSGDGTYAFQDIAFSGDPSVIIYLATSSTAQAATVTRTPTGDITGLDVYENYVIVRHEDAAPMTNNYLAVYDDNDDPFVPFNASSTTGTLTVDADTALVVWAGKEFAPGGDVTLDSGTGTSHDGSLVLQSGSTLTAAGTETYVVGGSWDAANDATFTASNGTVIFAATSSGNTIESYSPFYDMTLNGVGGVWDVTSALTVSEDFVVTAGTLTGTNDVTVENGTVTGDGAVDMTGGTFTVETGGNFGGDTDWTFNVLTFGDGVGGSTTKVGSGAVTTRSTLGVATGHTLNAGASEWVLWGSPNALAVPGTFNADTSTTTYATTTAMTITSLNYYNLVLAPAAGGSPTYTFANGPTNAENIYMGDGTNPVTVTADSNNPLITVAGDVVIEQNATYEGAGSNDIRIGGSYTNSGTYNHNGGGVLFNSTDAGETITSGGSLFDTVSFNGVGGGWTLVDGATTTGNLSLVDGVSLTLPVGERLEVQGVFSNSMPTATAWNGTVYLNSGTSYTLNGKTDVLETYDTLEIGAGTDVKMWNSTSTAYTVDPSGSLYSMDHNDMLGSLYIWGDYERTSGGEYWSYATDFDGVDLATTSSERPVSVHLADGATTTVSGGTFELLGAAGATTTVAGQGSGTYALRVTGGTFNAQYYRIRDIDVNGLWLSGTPNVTELGNADLLLETSGGTMLTVAGTVLDQNGVKTWGDMSFATSSGVSSGFNVTSVGSASVSWRFIPGTGNYYGEAFDNDTALDPNPGYLIFSDSDDELTIQGTVYSDEGSTVSTYCAGSDQVVGLMIEGEVLQTTTCDQTTGAYTFPTVSGYEPGDTIVVYITGTSTQAANVTQDLIAGVTLDLYERRVIVRHEDVAPMTIEGMAAWDSGDDGDLPYTASTSSSPHTLSLPADTKLIVWNNKTFVPGGDVTLNSGTGTSYDGTLELRDNATYESSASVVEDIVVGGSWLTGSGATFVAGTSSVIFVGTSSDMHVSPDASSFNSLTFNGVGGTWTFDDTAATTTSDFIITNGTVNVASSTLAVGGSFVNSGSMNAASTSITFSSTGNESVTFNGDEVGSLTFTGAGNFTMTDTDATSTGDVRIAAGSVVLPNGTFAVRNAFENVGGSFTHTNGTLRLYGNTAAQNLYVNGSTMHNIAVDGSGSWVFVDTTAVTTGSTTVSVGGLTAPAVSYSIGGSLINTGTYNPNGGATVFTATSTGKIVDPGGSVFGDVTFNGIGGGWTVATSATSTGDWLLTAGAAFTMASGTVLEVQGEFANDIGGLGTDWTDSVLYLNASGTSYAVNSKGVTGDQYATLFVGNHTDVALWNSAAATTTVAASSSLYSMDHNDQPGDLYIWGEYEQSAGADYWSYDRDFDGATLSGASRRPVDVRIASSSYISYTGGTLELDGDAGATTTVDVLGGTGTYDFVFTGSSFTMSYVSLRGLNAAGFRVGGSPTLGALNNVDFELAIDNGVAFEVAAAVIDQNPTQTYGNMYFASTSGVATGTNVKVTGATTNYWRLIPSFGNFDGEYADDDGIDACGAIRWDDSTCLEVSQAHYRFRADDGGEGAPDNEWYDQDWSYRKQITVSNPNASALSEYPVRMEIAAELGNMESNYSDLVFTDESGTSTIPFYVESYTAATATVWAKVPDVAGNDVVYIYMYYGNTFAVDAQNGSSTFMAFDDFEDNDIAEYSGDATNFDNSSSIYWQKDYGLAAASGKTGETTSPGIYRTDSTITQDSTIEFYQRVASGGEDEPCAYFGVQGSGQNYAVCLDQYPDDLVVLAKDVTSNDGSGTTIATSSISYTTGTYWYRVRVDWFSDDSIDVYVYDYTGSLVASISDSDNAYSSGGFGFGFWGQTQGWDFYTARPYAASEPTYMIGSAQQGGGASWKAAQDTAISQDSSTPFRVRFSVENSGPLQENQSYDLEYASMDGYGSCSAVASGDFDPVPNDAGCGVEAVCVTASPNFDDGDETSQLLSSASGLTFQSGYLVEDPSNDTPSNDLATSTLTEVEYAIELTSFASDPDYCLRVTDSGTDLDSYGQVARVSVNGVPVIGAWQLNAEQPIILTEGITTAITATGSASDVNGDLLYASTTIYRSGVGPDCTPNDNNCYKLICTPSCGLNECEYTCTANIQYFADPTDFGTYSGETWDAEFFVRDVSGNFATATAYNVELWSMNAVAVASGDINYGTLELRADTGLDSKESELQNTGNTDVDVQVEGTDLTGGVSTIQVDNQLYATSSFEYSTSTCLICSALTGSASAVELDLPKPTSTTPVLDSLYWGIYIPVGTEAVPHYGQNTFIAVSD